MLINARSIVDTTAINCEVCIVGGGVSGITLAVELEKEFNSIVLIESGGETFNQEIQNLYAPEHQPELYPNPLKSRLRFLGGSSNHWENSTNPFDPIDFEKRDWVPNSGWPINYDEVAKYYPRASEYCGVGNDGYRLDTWKSKLQGEDPFAASSVVDSTINKTSLPPTRFYEKFKMALKKSHNLTIYENANITDVNHDIGTGQTRSIVFKPNPDTKHEVKAKVFIICLGGIENARMLLTFNEKYNNSLGNQHDNVGRYFMDHPVIRGAQLYPSKKSSLDFYNALFLKDRFIHPTVKFARSALYANKINNMRIPFFKTTRYELSHGISSAHIIAEKAMDLEFPDAFGKHLMNIIDDIDLISESVSRKVFNETLFESSDGFGGYQIQAMIEQTPDRNNRIVLGNTRDPYNIRRININWRVTEDDKMASWKALDLLALEVGKFSLGRLRVLKERKSRIWTSQLGFGHHHMGTTRMGYSSNQGVVDTNLKVFGSNNLYMSGSSVFPTGGHVPPTLTITALSIRLAEHIIKRYKS